MLYLNLKKLKEKQRTFRLYILFHNNCQGTHSQPVQVFWDKSSAFHLIRNKSLQSTLALRTSRYYGHPAITDTPLLRTSRFYGHSAITDTPLLRTSRYYGHPAITDKIWIVIYRGLTENDSLYYGLSLFRTNIDVPKVSAITRADCIPNERVFLDIEGSTCHHYPAVGFFYVVSQGGEYSLKWTILSVSPERGYLFQDLGIWKGKDFTIWSINRLGKLWLRYVTNTFQNIPDKNTDLSINLS